MSAMVARGDGSMNRERDGNARGWGDKGYGKARDGKLSGGSTECQVCGKKGHTVDTCFRVHKCQICGKHGHLTSTCYQNPEYKGQQASQNRPSSNGPSPECQICSKKGHTAVNCFYRTDVSADHPSVSIPTCQICGLKGHAALNCTHRTNFAYQGSEPPASLVALTAQSSGGYNGSFQQSQGGYPVPTGASSSCFPGGFHPSTGASSSTSGYTMNQTGSSAPSNAHINNEVWIGDSGATHHMTSDLRNLTIAQPYTSDNKITIGNGTGLSVSHTGSSYIKPADHILRLNKVLHVPNLAMNLLSFTKLCRDNNCFITLDEKDIAVQDKASKTVLYQGKSSAEGLFLFKTPPVASIPELSHTAFVSSSTSYPVWHQRLGHPSPLILSKMMSCSQIKPPSLVPSNVCTYCLEGKMHRLPFTESVSKSPVPFHKIHSDVWGPAPCLAIEGYKYYVTFIDDCTKFVWIFPLINKSDVLAQFVKFYAFVHTQFDSTIKILQTDGGGEFNSKAFHNFLDSKGILHHITCPYTPQQNGVAERKNRHIVETAISLLSTAGLPKLFWFHSVAHSCYLINRMPCKSLNMISPYELVFHKVPDISQLKIFGSSCYPFLRPYNHDKLDPRTTKCVFLGYALGYKGVFCYSVPQNKLWMSRHVIHDETSFPFLSSSHPVSHPPDPVTFFPSSATSPTLPPQMPALHSPCPLSEVPTELEGDNGGNDMSNDGNYSDEVNGVNGTSNALNNLHNETDNEVSISGDTNGDQVNMQNEVNSDENSGIPEAGIDVQDNSSIGDIPEAGIDVQNNSSIGGLNANENNALQFGGNITTENLPQELDFIVNQNYNDHSMMTRAKNGIIKQKTFEDFYCFSAVAQQKLYDEYPFFSGFTAVSDISDVVEPRSFKAASGKSEWDQAMLEEIEALNKQGTWSLVPCPKNRNIVGSKWIYKVKKNPDGSVSRYKARLVAQGFSQTKGLDYDETFSPVVRHSTVRVILALAAMNNWELRQLDVKNAFLHGDLKEEVYMAQPQGFVDSMHPDYVCLLRKSLNGLKQAPRAWNEKFTSFLPSLGFTFSHSDPSLFIRHTAGGMIALLLYVDDIVITGSDTAGIHEVISELSMVFDMKDLGALSYFLGLEVTKVQQGIFLSQTKYAKDLLAKTGMDAIKACSSPCLPHYQMTKDQGTPLKDPTVYRSIVGALQYLTFTRPDMAYAVNTVCQFMTNPTDIHYAAVKRILRYLQGSLHKGLFYSSSGALNNTVCVNAFCDADWAGEVIHRRSTTGFVVYLGLCPVSWQSKKQGSVSRSSTESEYRSLANTAAEISWIRHLLCDLKVKIPRAPLLKCDNLSALALASNPVFHSKIKHLDNDFHFVRERVQHNDLCLEYVSTTEQTADILTKGLSSPIFRTHCVNLRLVTLAELEEGC
ncbi:hypothetical protein ABKV19_012545 [Rosa sericea]